MTTTGLLRERRFVGLGLVAVAVGALAGRWLADWRPDVSRAWSGREVSFVVNSGADRGAGSLREALFAANTADGPVSVTLAVDLVSLRTPLPPLVNPAGISIVAGDSTRIDADSIGPVPVFDIQTSRSRLQGMTVHGASGAAVLVRAPAVEITGITVRNSQTGVEALAAAQALVITGSRFENNDVGIRLEAADPATRIENNSFVGHANAAVWAVAAPSGAPGNSPLPIVGNDFTNDRLSMVLANLPVLVEDNQFAGARDAAVYVGGTGVTVRNNRVQGGQRYGILASVAHGVVIENNEVDRNDAVGIMLNGSEGTVLRSNRSYNNGYGIVLVFGDGSRPNIVTRNAVMSNDFDGVAVVGSAPVIRGNQAIGNRGAGVRILDYVGRTGTRVTSSPLVEANTMEGNGDNSPARGEYVDRR